MGCQLVVSTEQGGRAGGAPSLPPLHLGVILVSLPGLFLSWVVGPLSVTAGSLCRELGSGEGMSRSFQPVLLKRSCARKSPGDLLTCRPDLE